MESDRSEKRNPSFNFLTLSPLPAIDRSTTSHPFWPNTGSKWDLFAQIEQLGGQDIGKSLTTVQEMIQTVKVELAILELAKQTAVAGLGDGAEEEGVSWWERREEVEAEEEDDSEHEGFW